MIQEFELQLSNLKVKIKYNEQLPDLGYEIFINDERVDFGFQRFNPALTAAVVLTETRLKQQLEDDLTNLFEKVKKTIFERKENVS